MTNSEWIQVAEDIKLSLTDDVIEEAVLNYPGPVHDTFGDETVRILKARRDQLPEVAGTFYDLISGVVSVPGSNKRELFDVELLNETDLRVRVFKLSGKGELRDQYFDRTFLANETVELRLFGMGGDDRFRISGNGSNPIRIKIVGGSGADEYEDDTLKRGVRKTVEIHDTRQGNVITAGENTRVKLADRPENTTYNYRSDFRWNSFRAGLFFDYNNKEGVFLGGGPRIIRHGFRKHPSSSHFIRANAAPATGAANILYDGTWYFKQSASVRRSIDVKARLLFPDSYKNFFGLGNETTLNDRSLNFYRARLYQYSVEPRFVFERSIMEVSAGVRFRATNVDDDPDNIVSEPVFDISSGDFREQWFTGLTATLLFSDLDDSRNPRHGFRYMAGGELNSGIQNTTDNFSAIRSELELYFSLQTRSQVTLANRTGAAHHFGDFPFYEANTIGGTTNLRGFNGRRFSGRSAFFNNTELRLELFDFYRYLLGGKAGINAFFDTGRVWADGESSSVWHYGYGGGIWFNAFDSFLINGSVGFSEEDTIISIKTGFFF